ncbi:MAG: O-antigen translocase [Ginsengibacter sp.]
MIAKTNNSYQQILKSTSVLGGVQVFNILIAILRSKLIAVLLGPSGMGLMSLLTATIGLITGITNFGLGTSAVRNVASSAASGDAGKLGKTVGVFRRLVWLTGSLGFVLTLILSPLLSEIAFGNKAYTASFMLISFTLLFTQISAGQNVILQGMRKIQYMAKASMLGALAGLLISIPFYYFYAEKGIVPAIILTSLSTLSLSWFFANKVKIPEISIDKIIFKTEGKEMLKMGFLISLSGLITIGISYILRVFISSRGGLEDVGLFTAGFAIIGTYAGMVFTAMGADYYPRLATVANDNLKCKQEINQQAEIAILMLAPILILFLVFIQWGIVVLYSKQFVEIADMIHWATLGIFFQALSWSLGYVFLAKGASRTFFWNELIASAYMLGLNILGYYYFGLTGLGVSFLLAYFFYFIQMLLVCKKLYGIFLDSNTWKIFILQFSIAIFCFITGYFLNETAGYLIGSILILVSGIYSWKELNKRIDLKQIIAKRFKK